MEAGKMAATESKSTWSAQDPTDLKLWYQKGPVLGYDPRKSDCYPFWKALLFTERQKSEWEEDGSSRLDLDYATCVNTNSNTNLSWQYSKYQLLVVKWIFFNVFCVVLFLLLILVVQVFTKQNKGYSPI